MFFVLIIILNNYKNVLGVCKIQTGPDSFREDLTRVHHFHEFQ